MSDDLSSDQGEQIDKAHAALTTERRRRQRSSLIEMALVAGATVMIAVSTLFSAWNTFELRRLQQDQVVERKLILLGTECIVEQMAVHRHQTSRAHRADAGHHDFVYPIRPEEEPPPIPGKLEESCAVFISTSTTGKR